MFKLFNIFLIKMGIIRDDRKRMIAYLNEGLGICNGSCFNCKAKDEMLYDDSMISFLRNEYGIDADVGVLAKGTCSLGLALGTRLEDYGSNDTSKLKNSIVEYAKILKKDSVGRVDPVEIQSDMSFLRAYLALGEEKTPVAVNEPQEIQDSITTEIVPFRELPIMPKISRMSLGVRKNLKNHLNLLF